MTRTALAGTLSKLPHTPCGGTLAGGSSENRVLSLSPPPETETLSLLLRPFRMANRKEPEALIIAKSKEALIGNYEVNENIFFQLLKKNQFEVGATKIFHYKSYK
ncbi:hypothetical protein AVEN_240309-1 [Araneus ventricosus]|uniref:Uncharacterized protein n=1 Tax=Araneus ventricosus TaxID=182803 RepID=A0A4Y2FJF7_ARAVE|nr:hypothetical protein AVEN_240309-1 [Araneus ventricosus]